MQIYLVSALIFALIVAFFAIQNTTMVVVNFLIWEFEISLVLVILGAALTGAICIFLVGTFKNFGSWRKQRELEGKNKFLSEKVTNLEEELQKFQEKITSLEEQKAITSNEVEKVVQATKEEE